MAIRAAIRPVGLKKTKSKKRCVKGIRNAPAIMPMIARSKLERSGFKGLEIQ